MDFKVNDFTTINDFQRTEKFKSFTKHGEKAWYEIFTGTLEGQKVKGFISLDDENIYKLTLKK